MNLKTELKEFIKPLDLPGTYINFDTDIFCHIGMGDREFFWNQLSVAMGAYITTTSIPLSLAKYSASNTNTP